MTFLDALRTIHKLIVARSKDLHWTITTDQRRDLRLEIFIVAQGKRTGIVRTYTEREVAVMDTTALWFEVDEMIHSLQESQRVIR